MNCFNSSFLRFSFVLLLGPACQSHCSCVRCRKEREESMVETNTNLGKGNGNGKVSLQQSNTNGTRTQSTKISSLTHPSSSNAISSASSVELNSSNQIVSSISIKSRPTVSSVDRKISSISSSSSTQDRLGSPTNSVRATGVDGIHTNPSLTSLSPLRESSQLLSSCQASIQVDSIRSISKDDAIEPPTFIKVESSSPDSMPHIRRNISDNSSVTNITPNSNSTSNSSHDSVSSIYSSLSSVNDVKLDPIDRCVYILRGVPGSGKTSLAQQLSSQANHHFSSLNDRHALLPYTAICSNEAFFTDANTGKHVYDSNRIPESHSYCLAQFLQSISSNIPVIILDNPNCHMWEWKNYATLAAMVQYSVIVYEIICSDASMLATCFRRSQWSRSTQLSHEMMERMWSHFEYDTNARKIQTVVGANALSPGCTNNLTPPIRTPITQPSRIDPLSDPLLPPHSASFSFARQSQTQSQSQFDRSISSDSELTDSSNDLVPDAH